jgi:hypothetical protein
MPKLVFQLWHLRNQRRVIRAKHIVLGSPTVIAAAHAWREEAWHLEWFARRLRNDPAEFTKATQDRREARKRFYSVARVDLGIISGDIPAEVDPVA